ncbi:type II toxin-antitoxin system prevent-host-death family antitoxin [Tetragenococcus halophilus]|uniref:Antitoxin n=1 Tax=Tetragenococcus halophilus TaxID=51669 RepID=A0A3G5FHD0_TETHA|nr:type II toxin-antitoxin system prevent-host-death family antitoxin [Tetragenococcus halophilus]AYW49691.1 type II toxin-antitoxin system prevent-host-death family antitoxin [Tetragenococcus halophilus]MCF1602627.1 type II toxin-antitoxin system prevent-host-death family antitoxin [Tetragenococcus halophilus]MCO8285054.1 type II toxin-antitoxin system prevent-host-death family antitoxin [Tetragenococcus halophilus]MCO8289095.1 type II toxin-antitoxin system prevent-host-death family antitoxin
MNIKPISDLRNYNQVLQEVSNEQPVFLTKNGRGKYAVIDIEDYDKLKASLEIIEKLKEAETSGTIDLNEARERFQL